MKIAISLLLSTLPVLAAAEAPSHYQPMAFLAGSCWKGDLPVQGKVTQTDEPCFTWVYGGRFIRDRHVVHSSDGRPDYRGETVYYWDAPRKELDYLYFESDGGVSQGAVQPTGEALLFPATDYSDDGKVQTYRSRWQRSGDAAYDVVTEFKQPDGSWKAAWSVHMQKGRPAATD